MSDVKIKNKSSPATPLILPTGEIIGAGHEIALTSDRWAKVEGNKTVKEWIKVGALVVKGGSASSGDGGTNSGQEGNGGGGNGGDAARENEERLRAMKIPELTEAIEAKGGKDRVKSGMSKDDLVKIATELEA